MADFHLGLPHLPSVLVSLAGLLAGAIAAVTGFGIGSLLTPVFAGQTGTKLAVAAVAIPHLIGTAQRFWLLRQHIDRRILLGFGLASAVGGLAGALLQTRVSNRGLAIVFGLLLILAGISELTGWIQRVHPGRRAAWVAGILSGALGGLVGNQGGIRAAAMLGFNVPRQSFVATATAIALFVDGARLPVYLVTQGGEIARIWPLVLTATVGVVVGTAIGSRILRSLPQRTFRVILAMLLMTLGVYMLIAGPR
jgi:uncharacterized membrane protein YfcA